MSIFEEVKVLILLKINPWVDAFLIAYVTNGKDA